MDWRNYADINPSARPGKWLGTVWFGHGIQRKTDIDKPPGSKDPICAAIVFLMGVDIENERGFYLDTTFRLVTSFICDKSVGRPPGGPAQIEKALARRGPRRDSRDVTN